jgi:hypothetical protein
MLCIFQPNGLNRMSNKFPTKFTNPWDAEVGSTPNSSLPILNTTALATANSVVKPNPTSSAPTRPQDSWINNLTQSHEPKAPLQSKISPIIENIPLKSSSRAAAGSKNISESPVINQLSANANNTRHGSIATNNLLNRPPNNRAAPSRSQSLGADPFDADWAQSAARTGQAPTNPFARQQTFQVSM